MAGTELVVERAGALIGKRSELVRVSVRGETVNEVPLYGLEQVLIASEGVTLSSDVVRECAERGSDCLSVLVRRILPAAGGTGVDQHHPHSARATPGLQR